MAKILLIEDDAFLQKMYRKKFTVVGYQVDVASDGEEGLAKVKTVQPDVVVMDVMMPKLNGLEALQRMKADDTTKNIPVLILTNLSGTEDAETAVKRGAAGYLVKSDLTPDEVVDKVKAILGS
jgi:DNA-binding response OmpR family regulator